ncbi:DNA (cytosine-5-)-methyltransferase [Fusarium agapanthi]|uniref:DNA (Cytosine-5-)-methyltransferase n=1 Tax=Fusarium agapanthi TaxID=1803897 RepID=A0A9P5B440_9HYPO|nr:DNA (cytosine-5-)-methyltransferase [Fusarium agapanthi]
MFDTCLGAGGVSHEATMAGSLSFSGVYQQAKCALVLRSSVPCQYSSSVYTHAPAHGDEHLRTPHLQLVAEEAAFGVITADQIPDPARKRRVEPFNGSIGGFTQGHSVRWQAVRLYTWALPKTEGG